MLKPLFARVLVERDKLKSKGGILIPETAEKRNAPAIGTIISVGENCDAQIKDLKGRRVIFGRHAGDWIQDGDKDIYILQDEDILAVVSE